MPKKKPHKRGHQKPDTPSATVSSDTIYFHLPNVKPYGIFSQWAHSRFSIPISSLDFLTTRSPNAASILDTLAPSISFTCAEQSYMLSKALYFGDSKSSTLILGTSDPKTQKKIGRAVKGFSEYEWDKVKSRAARVGNWYKFTDERNQNMKRILLDTGDRLLAEASRQDRVWGIGYNEKEAEAFREMWGENLLGKCLCDVRRKIAWWEGHEAEVGDWNGELEEPYLLADEHICGVTDGEQVEEEEVVDEMKAKNRSEVSGSAH